MVKNKKLTFLLIGLLGAISLVGQTSGVSISDDPNATVNPNAILDISSLNNDKGILIPRMSSTERTTMILGVSDEGLTVYDETTKCYWLWDGATWVQFGVIIPSSGTEWSVAGNTGTNPLTDFIGTTDAQDLAFRVNNIERLRLDNFGRLIPQNTGFSIFIGENTGTSVNNNVFIGLNAGSNNGNDNIALGTAALRNNSGADNISIGDSTLFQNTTGSTNIAIGESALYGNTTGSSNVSVGRFSMVKNTSGSQNVALGNFSLYENLSGSGSIAIGFNALQNFNSNGINVAIGYYSQRENFSGNGNTSLGVNSLEKNNSGNNNVALGAFSSANYANGSNNVSIGFEADLNNLGGDNNVVIGYRAGGNSSNLTNKSGNIFIGFQAGYNESGSNKLYIENSSSSSPLIGGDFSLDEVYINGRLGINTGSPSSELDVNGTITTTALTIPTGAANGHVLTSDAVGRAFWSAPNTDVDWTLTNNDMYSGVSGNIGIGTSTPMYDLTVHGAVMLHELSSPPVKDRFYAGIYTSIGGELNAYDGDGNSTIISPHHFSLIPKSEEMAWSFYSKNEELDKQVNVDMMKAMRLIESITGEKIVYIADLQENEIVQSDGSLSLVDIIEKQKQTINDQYVIITKLESEIKQIDEILENLSQKINE